MHQVIGKQNKWVRFYKSRCFTPHLPTLILSTFARHHGFCDEGQISEGQISQDKFSGGVFLGDNFPYKPTLVEGYFLVFLEGMGGFLGAVSSGDIFQETFLRYVIGKNKCTLCTNSKSSCMLLAYLNYSGIMKIT